MTAILKARHAHNVGNKIPYGDFVKRANIAADVQAVLRLVPAFAGAFRAILPYGSLIAPDGAGNAAGDCQEAIDKATEYFLTHLIYNPSGNIRIRNSLSRALSDDRTPLKPLDKALIAFHGGEEADRVIVGNLLHAIKYNKGRIITLGVDSLDGTSTLAGLQALGTFLTIYSLQLTNAEQAEILRREKELRFNPGFLAELHRGKTGREMVAATAMINFSSSDQITIAAKEVNGLNRFVQDSSGKFVRVAAPIITDGPPIIALGGAPAVWQPQPIWPFVQYLREKEGALLNWTGGGTPDFQRTLVNRNAIYGYPADERKKSGRLRPFYELLMMAFMMDKIGGRSIYGKDEALDTRMDPPAKDSKLFHHTKPFMCGQDLNLMQCLSMLHHGASLSHAIEYRKSENSPGK